MTAAILRLIKEDPKLKFIFWGGLIIQLLFSITATGYYQVDQHTQVIEFATWKLGEPSMAPDVWEFTNHVRSSLQVWLFAGWHQLSKFIGLSDPYLELTALRIILGLIMYVVFNATVIHFLKNNGKSSLYIALLLLNFGWYLPYTRTLYSSEMLSSLLFFGTVCWYDSRKDRSPGFLFLFITGLLLNLAFYTRFQSGFFMAAFGVWLLFEKKYRHILPIMVGFIFGSLANLAMDYAFYDRFVITPYEYYMANIVDERAASFGTSPVTRYLGVLIAYAPLFPINIVLYFFAFKSPRRYLKHILFLSIGLFVLGHSMVGHKEERFMFPLLNIIPVVLAWGWPPFQNYLSNCKKFMRYLLRSLIIVSVVLNFLLLILFLFNPHNQTVRFTAKLKKQFSQEQASIYCLIRSPYAIPHLPFYEKSFPYEIRIIEHPDSLSRINERNIYVMTSFDNIKDKNVLLRNMGYRPVFYSSNLLWNLNKFLYSRGIHPITESWALYYKE